MKYEHRIVAVDADDETRSYTFECACGFTSSGWALKKHATERGVEHLAEHDTGEPGTELVDFRAERDLNGELVTTVRFEDEGAGR